METNLPSLGWSAAHLHYSLTRCEGPPAAWPGIKGQRVRNESKSPRIEVDVRLQVTALTNAFKKYVMNESWNVMYAFSVSAMLPTVKSLLVHDDELYSIYSLSIPQFLCLPPPVCPLFSIAFDHNQI